MSIAELSENRPVAYVSDNAQLDVLGFDASLPAEYSCQVWIYSEDCGGFSAELIALPGVVSQGETEEEAIANLREAFKGISSLIGRPVPRFRGPTRFRGIDPQTRRKSG